MTPTQQSHSVVPSASLAVKRSSAEYKKEGEGILLLQQTPSDPFPASKTVMTSESEDWTLDDQDTAPITPEGFFVDHEDSQIRHFKNLTVNDDDDNTPAFGLDGEDYDIEGDDENVVSVAVDDDHEAMIRVLNEEEEEDNERLKLLLLPPPQRQ